MCCVPYNNATNDTHCCCTVNNMDGVQDQLEQAARRLAAARTEHHAATTQARTAARTAATAGTPETRIAATLRVDRATIRKWLGK